MSSGVSGQTTDVWTSNVFLVIIAFSGLPHSRSRPRYLGIQSQSPAPTPRWHESADLRLPRQHRLRCGSRPTADVHHRKPQLGSILLRALFRRYSHLSSATCNVILGLCDKKVERPLQSVFELDAGAAGPRTHRVLQAASSAVVTSEEGDGWMLGTSVLSWSLPRLGHGCAGPDANFRGIRWR